MNAIVTVEVEGLSVDLDVEGAYQPYEKQSLEHPGFSDCFEVESIKINDTELIHDLPSDVIDRIANMVLEDILDEEA